MMADFFQQVQKLIGEMGEIISQTVEQQREELSKFEENAESKVLLTFENVKKQTKELSDASATYKARIQEKEAEIRKIESNMRNSLFECYTKNYKPIDKLQKERNDIHEEAIKLKEEAQKMMSECLKGEDKQKCFEKGFSQIEKKTQKLLKKFHDLLKKETNTRVECTKLMLECDKKAVNTAEKKISKIMDQIKKSGG